MKNNIGFICIHLVIGACICAISSINNYTFIISLEKYIIQWLIALISFNFVLCTSTSNALLKVKETNSDIDISSLIKELKESFIAQIIGLLVVLAVLLVESFSSITQYCISVFILNSLLVAVLSMYVGLIIDIALAFFRIMNEV